MTLKQNIQKQIPVINIDITSFEGKKEFQIFTFHLHEKLYTEVTC